jgi:hypothetical protein
VCRRRQGPPGRAIARSDGQNGVPDQSAVHQSPLPPSMARTRARKSTMFVEVAWQRVNAGAESHRYLAEPSPKIRQEVASVASCKAMGVARKRVGDYDDLVLELRRVASRGLTAYVS